MSGHNVPNTYYSHDFSIEYKNGQPWLLKFRCPECKFHGFSPSHHLGCKYEENVLNTQGVQ